MNLASRLSSYYMNSLFRLFSEHPASVGETYGQHLASAAGFSGRMIVAGIACLIHALLPFLFVRTGSNAIARLHDRMIVNRARQASVTPSTSRRTDPKVLPTS
jgi:hypothetical protein